MVSGKARARGLRGRRTRWTVVRGARLLPSQGGASICFRQCGIRRRAGGLARRPSPTSVDQMACGWSEVERRARYGEAHAYSPRPGPPSIKGTQGERGGSEDGGGGKKSKDEEEIKVGRILQTEASEKMIWSRDGRQRAPLPPFGPSTAPPPFLALESQRALRGGGCIKVGLRTIVQLPLWAEHLWAQQRREGEVQCNTRCGCPVLSIASGLSGNPALLLGATVALDGGHSLASVTAAR